MWVLVRFDRRNTSQHKDAMVVHEENRALLQTLHANQVDMKKDLVEIKMDATETRADVRELRLRVRDIEADLN